MADEPTNEENNQEEEEDFGALTGGEDSEESDSMGMGSSLPPLSDFDSAEMESSGDSDLPPLDTPEAQDSPVSGLPPIVDIKVDTPAVRPSDLDTPEPSRIDQQETPTPAGFDTPDLDSPEPSGLGFQDFAADSDFSPETPEIGPGPDSDIETPMFDSAFGGDSGGFMTSDSGGTPAPTQAMETPMFGGESDDAGGGGGGGMDFDNDAFGAATPDVGADTGTPVPDFSPDTGAGIVGAPSPGAVPVVKKKRSIVGALKYVVLAVVVFAGGLFASPFLAPSIPFITDPSADALASKDADIRRLEGEVARLVNIPTSGDKGISPEELKKLITQYENTQGDLTRAKNEFSAKQEQLSQLNNQLALVRADIEQKNNEFVENQELVDELKNEAAITEARHAGLLAENDRLSEVVGLLEVANARRQSTKDTLLHNVDLLIVQVQGGSPLTPERFNHNARLARVNALRDKVARAKWVDPQLLDEYTNLYIQELGIGSSREYFFARIPVQDRLGTTSYQWAECLMNGNWSVYFRTIDGKNIGSYENTAGSGPSKYEFREDIPSAMREDILQAITAARVEGYEEKIAVLEGKQAIYENKTDLQRSFSSL